MPSAGFPAGLIRTGAETTRLSTMLVVSAVLERTIVAIPALRSWSLIDLGPILGRFDSALADLPVDDPGSLAAVTLSGTSVESEISEE
jgi:hypothetical protein